MQISIARIVFICATLEISCQAARADKIDAKLHEQAPVILAALKKMEVKNVGVLRFRAELGKKAELFDIGPINDGLAARIENLLIIHADRSVPVGVLRNPSRESATAKLGPWFSDIAARRKYFQHEYPLAWGSSRAKPDAFLTGKVLCKGDMSKTSVIIESFTAKDPAKLIKVCEFTVPTDRLILADLGERFSIARRSGAVRRSVDLDRFAIGEARRREGDQSDGDSQSPPEPEPTNATLEVGGVAFKVLSGEEAVSFRASSGSGAKWELASPPTDKPITMVLKNSNSKRIGVVLKVNEMSTIFDQIEDSALCRKWVIEPGMEISLRGFYRQDKKYAPFKVLVGDDAKQMIDQLGDKAGRVRLEVFEESGSEDDTSLSVSLPRRLPETKIGPARRNLGALQASLMKQARVTTATKSETVNGRVVKREIIVPDKEALLPSSELKEVDFKSAASPIAVEQIQIVKP